MQSRPSVKTRVTRFFVGDDYSLRDPNLVQRGLGLVFGRPRELTYAGQPSLVKRGVHVVFGSSRRGVPSLPRRTMNVVQGVSAAVQNRRAASAQQSRISSRLATHVGGANPAPAPAPRSWLRLPSIRWPSFRRSQGNSPQVPVASGRVFSKRLLIPVGLLAALGLGVKLKAGAPPAEEVREVAKAASVSPKVAGRAIKTSNRGDDAIRAELGRLNQDIPSATGQSRLDKQAQRRALIEAMNRSRAARTPGGR